MAGKTKSQKKKALDMRSKMYLVLALCSVMLLVSVGISLVLIGGIDLGGADAQSVSTVDSASMVVESGYNKEENTIDTQAYTSTILEQTSDAGDSYVDETLFLGDSNTARMYRMFDYCSYDNAIGSVGMTAKSLVTFACVQVSTSSGYITMPQAVAKLQPRRVILTFGTNDLNPGYKAADFVKNYRTGIEAIVTAYPSVDIIVNAIPPIGQQHSNQSLTQTQVDEYNKALVEMCQEKGWKFLNSAEVLKDSVTGYAKSGYVETSDGIHLTRTAMDALFTYIRTHSYITEDDRPALTTIPKHTGDKDAVVYTVPVVSSSSTATATATPEPTEEPANSESTSDSYVETTPTPTPEVTATPSPTPEVTATPSPTPEVTATPSPTPEVTATPSPTPYIEEPPPTPTVEPPPTDDTPTETTTE
uniref:GDSL-type esterase/lipase family protein n=1 Tax=Gemmiger formicilis TaxID=745368 RepID=UPI0040269CED